MGGPLDVLLVEDDPSLREVLAIHFGAEGWLVRATGDGLDAIAQCRARAPHVAVLDVSLPGASGIEICQHLRDGYSPAPGVVMVTARGSEVDVLLGLDVGADDYVVKPCRPREVVARVRALARRVRPELVEARSAGARVLGPLVIDTGAMRVTVRGAEVKLTATELALLAELSARPDVVHPRGELLQSVFGLTHEGYSRNVDCHVARVRKKLEAAGLGESPIHTVHGVGYRFVPPRGA